MFASHQNSDVEVPIPEVMVLGGGASGRGLQFNEVMRVGPNNGIYVLIRRGTGELVLPHPNHHVRTQRKGCLQAGSERSPGTKSASNYILELQPPEEWEKCFCGLRHLDHGMCYGSLGY